MGTANAVVVLECYSQIGDGGGGLFIWKSANPEDESSLAALVDNGGTILNVGGLGKPPSTGRGAWFRLYTGPLNVKWFGARGNGVASDSAAINSALGALGSHDCALWFPAGIYVISEVMLLPNGAKLSGEHASNTVIRAGVDFTHNTPMICTKNHLSGVLFSNIVIEDLTLDGGAPKSSLGAWADGQKLIFITHCTHAHIRRCIGTDCYEDGFTLEFCQNSAVSDCTLTRCRKAALHFFGCDFCQLLNTAISYSWIGAVISANFYTLVSGCEVTRNPEFNFIIGRDSEFCAISNNLFDSIYVNAEAVGELLPFSGYDLLPHPNGEPWLEGQAYGCYRCVFSNNIIQGGPTTPSGITLKNSNYNILEGNCIRGSQTCGLQLTNSSHNNIRGNSISCCSQSRQGHPALLVDSDFAGGSQYPSSNHNIIEDNRIHNGESAQPLMWGIAISAVGCSGNIVRRNRILTPFPLWSPLVPSDSIVENNTFASPTAARTTRAPSSIQPTANGPASRHLLEMRWDAPPSKGTPLGWISTAAGSPLAGFAGTTDHVGALNGLNLASVTQCSRPRG